MDLFVSNPPRHCGALLHILHVIVSLSPAAGGPPEALRQLARAYLDVGDGIEIVCLDKPDEAFLNDFPCPVHALGQSFLGVFGLSTRITGWLKANASRFDGIVMHGIWTFPGLAVRSAARRSGKPYGIFTHGGLDPWFNRTYPLKHLKKLIYWPLQHPVLRDAQAVFFTTAMERDLAVTSFRPSNWKSVVVPFGIHDPEERSADSKAQIEVFYRKFPQLRGRRFLLFLGRIHEKKGCDLLLQAFATVAGEHPGIDLVMAGPAQSKLRTTLQQLADKLGVSGHVHWPGMVGGDIKWGAIRACDAFVLPSHQENFGIAVVEALAVGSPVLISNQVNIWPEIEADAVGLVDEDTLEGTYRLLRRWLELRPEEREAMAARARPCFLRRYTTNLSAVAINEVLCPSEVVARSV
jgi:glycosyltransferase involved in cell wall biosynthesis